MGFNHSHRGHTPNAPFSEFAPAQYRRPEIAHIKLGLFRGSVCSSGSEVKDREEMKSDDSNSSTIALAGLGEPAAWNLAFCVAAGASVRGCHARGPECVGLRHPLVHFLFVEFEEETP